MGEALGRAPQRWVLVALVAVALPAPRSGGESARDAVPKSPLTILQNAFDRRYEVDLSLNIELVMRDDEGHERRRLFRAASKRIEDRMHSIGRIVWPNHLRGMTILTIEADSNRGNDSFVYMPTLDKVRRVSTAQRSDSFLGSDVTYEDLERRHPEDFVPEGMRELEVDGERAWEIRARPTYSPNYERISFVVAQADYAILEVYYYKWGDAEPYRIVKAPRSTILSEDGYVIPLHLVITNFMGRTTTEVTFTDLVINPDIPDRTFSAATLERQRGTILGD